MYVVCFYWQGDRWQSGDYKAPQGHRNLQRSPSRYELVDINLASRYVNNLYHGVERFTERPFKFICFTNEPLQVDNGVELRYLPMVTRHGVLPRMYMFSREAGLFGYQVLSLDLDITIVGSLEPLMKYEGMFCTRSKFKPDEITKLDGDIMSF